MTYEEFNEIDGKTADLKGDSAAIVNAAKHIARLEASVEMLDIR